MNDIKEQKDTELSNATGGGAPITYNDNCIYNPSHFKDAHDPHQIGGGECSYCVYNHHRSWANSTCSYHEEYDEITKIVQ